MSKSKVIDSMSIVVKPWGFFTLIERKRKVYELFKGTIDELKNVINPENETEITINTIIDIIGGVISTFDEKTLREFVELMFDNTTINGVSCKDFEAFENETAGKSFAFYEVLMFIVEANYGDFLAKIKHLISSKYSQLKDSELK